MQSTHASSQPKTSGTRGRPRETTIQRLSGPHWKFEQSFWTADGKAAKTILEKTPVNTNDPSALKGPSKFGDHLHYGYDGARGFGTVNVEGPKTSFLRAANGKTSKYEWTTVSGLPRMFANELPWLHTEDYFTVQCTPTGIEEIRRTVSRPSPLPTEGGSQVIEGWDKDTEEFEDVDIEDDEVGRESKADSEWDMVQPGPSEAVKTRSRWW